MSIYVQIVETDILSSGLVGLSRFLFLNLIIQSRLCSVSPPFLLLTSLVPLIHQVALSIASQDYPIQHGVWEKMLVMADTLLISFNLCHTHTNSHTHKEVTEETIEIVWLRVKEQWKTTHCLSVVKCGCHSALGLFEISRICTVSITA